MTPAPVGLRCPEHAGGKRGARPLGGRVVVRAPQTRLGSQQALVTKILVAANVAIYLVGAVQGAGVNAPGGRLYLKMILFGPYVDLAGYPPWQLRLTEIFQVRDNQGVGYQVFLRGLYKFANAEMRLGR